MGKNKARKMVFSKAWGKPELLDMLAKADRDGMSNINKAITKAKALEVITAAIESYPDGAEISPDRYTKRGRSDVIAISHVFQECL